jgi:hypothetical protein
MGWGDGPQEGTLSTFSAAQQKNGHYWTFIHSMCHQSLLRACCLQEGARAARVAIVLMRLSSAFGSGNADRGLASEEK